MVNYAHAVIYRIINKETNENLYIGSTTDYNRRMREHKCCCNNSNAHEYNYPIYIHIRELGGWNFVKHIMIEEFTTCQNKLQLVKREQEHMDLCNSSKNAIRSYITEKQRQDQKNETQKKYYDSHKEHIKEYRLDNKDKIKEYSKQYYLKKKNEQTELVQSTIL